MRSLLFVETHPKHLHISPSCDCSFHHTLLIHSRLQSLLGLYVGKHIRIYVLSTYIRETHARIYAFIG